MPKMRKRLLLIVLFFTLYTSVAQDIVEKPDFVNYAIDSLTKKRINTSLELLFSNIIKGVSNSKYLTSKHIKLTESSLKVLEGYESRKDSVTLKIQDKRLINMYPISDHEYSLLISYTIYKSDVKPKIAYLVRLIATENNGNITFSIPLEYYTRYWKIKEIGNVTYHYRGQINKERALLFDQKNTKIANRLGVKPQKLNFYMCDDLQEILRLRGFEYAIKANGQYRDGYGVVAKTIFSVMNNEDFSHDMFHYYSGQINEHKNRNWITEEGVAYSWGNAYYTDRNGGMITHKRLVGELRNYLKQNPKTNLFDLFRQNRKIFSHIAPEISARSTIAGLIVNRVEREKGIEGVLKLINAGRQDKLKSFLKRTEELIGLNQDNFNSKVEKLILDY